MVKNISNFLARFFAVVFILTRFKLMFVYKATVLYD